MYRLNITTYSPCRLTDRNRASSTKGFKDIPSFGSQYFPKQFRRGEAMRSSVSGRSAWMTRDTSANVSAKERTSRTTVFIVPPLNVNIEVCHQLVRSRKDIRLFDHTSMAMISLPSLIIITYHTLSGHNVRQLIFILMPRRRHRLRYTPHHYFGKCVYGQHNTST